MNIGIIIFLCFLAIVVLVIIYEWYYFVKIEEMDYKFVVKYKNAYFITVLAIMGIMCLHMVSVGLILLAIEPKFSYIYLIIFIIIFFIFSIGLYTDIRKIIVCKDKIYIRRGRSLQKINLKDIKYIQKEFVTTYKFYDSNYKTLFIVKKTDENSGLFLDFIKKYANPISLDDSIELVNPQSRYSQKELLKYFNLGEKYKKKMTNIRKHYFNFFILLVISILFAVWLAKITHIAPAIVILTSTTIALIVIFVNKHKSIKNFQGKSLLETGLSIKAYKIKRVQKRHFWLRLTLIICLLISLFPLINSSLYLNGTYEITPKNLDKVEGIVVSTNENELHSSFDITLENKEVYIIKEQYLKYITKNISSYVKVGDRVKMHVDSGYYDYVFENDYSYVLYLEVEGKIILGHNHIEKYENDEIVRYSKIRYFTALIDIFMVLMYLASLYIKKQSISKHLEKNNKRSLWIKRN